MFRIVKSSTLDKLRRNVETLTRAKQDAARSREALIEENRKHVERIEDLESSLKSEETSASVAAVKLADAKSEIDRLQEEVERLNGLLTNSEHNEVTLRMSDDLLTMTPIVRWKPHLGEKLYEIGYLRDTDGESPMAIQLALMSVGYEALTQLVESFEQPVKETE